MTINCGPEPSNHSCTYAISKIIQCKTYVDEGKGNGVQVSTKGKCPFKGGGKAGFFCQHLEGVDKGRLGIGCHTRVQNTFFRDTSPISQTTRRGIFSASDSSNAKGSGIPPTKRSNLFLPQQPRWFLFNLIPSPQKESDAASDQSETIEQVGGNPTLQNGGYLDPHRPVENRLLDGEGRFEGCLLHNSHSQSSPAVTQISDSRSLLPIHLPPI